MTIEQCIKPELNIRVNHAIQISDWEGINQAHSLMRMERLSAGGNIRDKSPEDLAALISGGGQLWTLIEERTILSVCTLEPKTGRLPWWYINNGITHPEHRGRGLSGQLVESVVHANAQTDTGFIVLYVRQNLFERLGFTEVSV
ncbi:MAG: GNAT family N-acetyltransferase, partial [Patescibacteria group bacterium]